MKFHIYSDGWNELVGFILDNDDGTVVDFCYIDSVFTPEKIEGIKVELDIMYLKLFGTEYVKQTLIMTEHELKEWRENTEEGRE